MRTTTDRVTVTIAVPLQPELVARIRGGDQRLEVLHAPELLPPPRYPNDHRGVDGFVRPPEGERRWQEMLGRAEVLFGIPGDRPQGLAAAAASNPGLRWVQATAAGAGEQVRAAGLTSEELARVTVTSATGVHAVPLAEFCLFGLLAFAKSLPRLLADQRTRHWDHYPTSELGGRVLLIVGLGQIGEEVARLAGAFGMRTIGVNRSGVSHSPYVHEVRTTADLADLVPLADGVVISLPLTDETMGLLGAAAIKSMKHDAVLVNVGRGGVIDEAALIEALREHQIAGAVLDVYDTEPLPRDSPLWELPNALLSPHTAALSPRENERIVDLFMENVRRYLRGDELLSRVDPQSLY